MKIYTNEQGAVVAEAENVKEVSVLLALDLEASNAFQNLEASNSLLDRQARFAENGEIEWI